MKTYDVRVLIVAGDGINCDHESQRAFELAGAKTSRVFINTLTANPKLLLDFHILMLPGGFSYADYLGSGTVLASKIKLYLMKELSEFIKNGGLIIGICNGFQILTKLGFFDDHQKKVALTWNNSGKFVDKWVKLKLNPNSKCVFTKGLENIDLPIRHGEGRFVVNEDFNFPEDQIVFSYTDNPNGSFKDIAGVCDSSGQVLGLMPHPEAYIYSEQHPEYYKTLCHPETAKQAKDLDSSVASLLQNDNLVLGIEIFKRGVDYVKKIRAN